MADGSSFFPIFPYLSIERSILPSSPKSTRQSLLNLLSSVDISESLPSPYWSALENLSLKAGFPFSKQVTPLSKV